MKRLIKKAFRDILKDRRRAAFSLVAIFLGTLAFGVVTFSQHIINREIVSEYDKVNPASASLYVDRVDGELLELLGGYEGISFFEDKAHYELRVILGDGESKLLELFAARDFSTLFLHRIEPISGSLSPADGEAMLERQAMRVADTAIDESITVILPDGNEHPLIITGIIADTSRHPAAMHNSVYAYISYNTLLEWGLVPNKVDFLISGNPFDREKILSTSNDIIKILESNGYQITRLEVSETPGISMHQEEYKSSLLLLQIFSVVTFLFGCMIMSSLISSILSAQIRQVGILKTIGADTRQIIFAYLVAFATLIVGTVAVSLPILALLSGSVSTFLLGFGNMVPTNTSVPLMLYLLYGALGLVVPILVALFPIKKGVRIPVRSALDFSGATTGGKSIPLPEPKHTSRPVLLSLRNAARPKRRFILNVTTLGLAGALFVSIVVSMLSIQSTLDGNLETWKFDYQIMTSPVRDVEQFSRQMQAVPNVTGYEVWGSGSAKLIYDSGETGNLYTLAAPPDGTAMLAPDMVEGQWLDSTGGNSVVVSHKFFESEPLYRVGDTVVLQSGDNVLSFVIVGSMLDLGTTTIYMNQEAYNHLVPAVNQINNVKMSLSMEGRRKAVFHAVEEGLTAQGIPILQSQSKSEMADIYAGHFTVTLQTFMFISLMLVVIAGFGLAATMNAQTAERTKEIGVMRAIGASRRKIMRIITSESIFLGLVGWALSIIAGIPLGIIGVQFFGNIMGVPITSKFTGYLIAYIVWLCLAVIVGFFASHACAKKATKMSIRCCLAY